MISWCRKQSVGFRILLAFNLLVLGVGLIGYAVRGEVHADGVAAAGLLASSVGSAPGGSGEVRTGNELDLLISGRGYFQVELPDGNTAYTREGAFRLSADGEIVTKKGYPLSPSITLPDDYVEICVSAEGRVSARVSGQKDSVNLGDIQLARFMNVEGLEQRGVDGLLLETSESGCPVVAAPGGEGLGFVKQGFVERGQGEWVNSLFAVLGSAPLELGNVSRIQNGDGVDQLLIVVNLK